jgi:hypothetical protein
MSPWLQLTVGFALGVTLAALAFWAGALTRSGALAAALLGGLLFGLGGLRWAALLLLFFTTSSSLSHLSSRRKSALAQAYIELPLRLAPDGSAVDLVPGVRILLLPVVNTFFYMLDLLSGLFFYRRPETQPLAYLMWSAGTLTAAFFLAAVWFLLRAA